MPVKSLLASRFHTFTDIYYKLEMQNETIYEREQQFGGLEKELTNMKGIFKRKQHKELWEQQTSNKVESDSIQHTGKIAVKAPGSKERNVKTTDNHRRSNRGGR